MHLCIQWNLHNDHLRGETIRYKMAKRLGYNICEATSQQRLPLLHNYKE